MLILSTNLALFPLPENLQRVLHRDDVASQLLLRNGRECPEHITVSPTDYARIGYLVREFSDGRVSIRDVHWNGRALAMASAQLLVAEAG